MRHLRFALWITLTIALPAAADSIVPSVARTDGRNNAFFLTDARFLNTSKMDAVTVGVTFYPTGGEPVSAEEFMIGPREQIAHDNIVESLFGITDNVTGLLRVAAPDIVEVSTRTFNRNDPCTGGTLGTWIPGIPEADAILSGIIPQAAGSSNSLFGYRTNVIIANPGTETATVTVYVTRGNGARIGSSVVSIEPNAAFLGDVFALVGSTDTETNAFIEFESDQPVHAISSVVDNRTNDSAVFVARASEAPNPSTLVMVGDRASFSGAYGVSGIAEITSPTTIQLKSFNANGTAPGMDVRLGKAGESRQGFAVASVLGRQSFNNATLDITIPEGVDLDSFDTVTIWCFEFNVIITEGMFSTP